MFTPKIIFQDGEILIEESHKKFYLIRNFLNDGHEIIPLHRYEVQTFLDLLQEKYNIKTLALGDFLMAPEEIMIRNFIKVAEQTSLQREKDLDLIMDSEFLKK